MMPLFEYVYLQQEDKDYSEFIVNVIYCRQCKSEIARYTDISTEESLKSLELRIIEHYLFCVAYNEKYHVR